MTNYDLIPALIDLMRVLSDDMTTNPKWQPRDSQLELRVRNYFDDPDNQPTEDQVSTMTKVLRVWVDLD